MNRVKAFFNSQQGISHDFSYDFALRRLCVAKEDSWRGILPSTYSSDFNPEPPIFSAKFANCDGYRHIVALANEDGKIALQDTTLRNYEEEEKALEASQCHFNAVFDLEWAPGQMKFVSASGDHSARLWSVSESEIVNIREFVGHTRSVKTAAFRRNDPSVFATGGRDGAIIIWDTRANLNIDFTPRADNCIYSGHIGGPGTPTSQRKRTRTPKMSQPLMTVSSITGLAFQDTNTLISCGAGDGAIKVWDLRRNYTTYKKEPHPKYSLPYPGVSTFRGFTNLLVDQAGTRLYVNCMDNNIYSYNLRSYSPKPLASYKGLLNSTFYIKACLSPDDKYLLSGSSDNNAYIWNVNYPDEPLVALAGHAVEVTCVAWGAVHDRPIVTCSDDARHKIWRIGPDVISKQHGEELYRGQANYVRSFGKKIAGVATHCYNLRDLETTPRSLRAALPMYERTLPAEKSTKKRSFMDMLGASKNDEEQQAEQQESKRTKALETTRCRRLFGPSTSTAAAAAATATTACFFSNTKPGTRAHNSQLSVINEECFGLSSITSPTSSRLPTCNQDSNNAETTPPNTQAATLSSSNKTPTSPLSTRLNMAETHNFLSPSTTAASASMAYFSPTCNLPNYVLNGEAPHLSLMSPKRKPKDKVDWLTKIRKQKLMSAARGASNPTDKLQDEQRFSAADETAAVLSSPRLQGLRSADARLTPTAAATPRRRRSSSSAQLDPSMSPSAAGLHPRTPNSSRRHNNGATILRFFNRQTQRRSCTDTATTAETETNANAANAAACAEQCVAGQQETEEMTAHALQT